MVFRCLALRVVLSGAILLIESNDYVIATIIVVKFKVRNNNFFSAEICVSS